MKNKNVSKQSTKFLSFNNTNIYFIDVDGVYWIAFNPICKALKIDESRTYKNLKKHKIFAPALANQPMQVSNNGIIQVRNMTCIPEKYIYGWLLSINSENENLLAFQKECYELLYNHFHGTITKRMEILEKKAEVIVEKETWFAKLKETNEYQQYVKAKTEVSNLNAIITKSDNSIVHQKIKNLFEQDFVSN